MPDEADNARLSRMLVEIDQDAEGLSEWEVNFVSDLIDRQAVRFSEKQAAVLERIWRRCFKDGR